MLLPFATKEGAGGPPRQGFFGGWLVILRDPNADFALPELTLGPDIDIAWFDARKQLVSRRATP